MRRPSSLVIKRIFLLLAPCIFVAVAVHAGTLELRFSADGFSIAADRVPLQDILKHFAATGTAVRIDPSINPPISAAFKDRKLQDGLESVLKPFNHVLIWESVPVSGGTVSRLAEIQVFRPGRQERMQPLLRGAALALEVDPKTGWLFVRDELLVKLKAGADPATFRAFLARIGGRVTGYDGAGGIYRIRLPDQSDVPGLAESILKDPDIEDAEPNYAYPVSKSYPYPSSETTVPDAAQVSDSQGRAPVAIFDTGLMTGSGLEGLVLATLDTLEPGKPISDTQGHGTQMALIASGAVKPQGIAGDAAPDAPLIPIRVFDANGYTSGFQLMEGIDFALRNGARVLSLSWGAETDSRFLESALSEAAAKGLVIVASAGNEPTGRPVYPAAYPSVIGVGALDPDGNVWQQSNSGAFVSLYAPGFAYLPVGYQGKPGRYAGTSIAAAYTANRIAAYLSAHPDAGVQEILKALRTSNER